MNKHCFNLTIIDEQLLLYLNLDEHFYTALHVFDYAWENNTMHKNKYWFIWLCINKHCFNLTIIDEQLLLYLTIDEQINTALQVFDCMSKHYLTA